MKQKNITSKISLIVATVFLLGAVYFGVITNNGQKFLGSGIGLRSPDCTVETSSSVLAGHQSSRTILSQRSNRAWAIIQVPNNATNTYYLNFDEGNDATVNTGVVLNGYSVLGASSTPSIAFGLNTDMPYTGAVTGITNYGSSTLNVIECIY